ncbi:hypothetical protein JGH11_12715, partial [Dysgonomonas sp. Marseille-P4677]|uniref:hypothetical protein n=1 Tax=Dysgonomonas sp. Marseille-P4677 TaxID=2364790 RepID=UPI001912C354
NIYSLLLLGILSFVGIESAKAEVILFNQNLEYIEQIPGDQPAKLISTIYSGDTYTFYILSSGNWVMETTPSGLSFSVNGGTFVPSYASGGQGYYEITAYADPAVVGPFKTTITLIENGVKYNYQLSVEKKPNADGKFSCPTTTVEATPGFSQLYPNVVSLTVTGKPILLTSGRLLGKSDDGKITVSYTGDPMAVSSGTKNIPVTVSVASDAKEGKYDIKLDQISNVEASCAWVINVTKPSTCNFALDCANPIINPAKFTQNAAANSTVSINYTLSGCTSYEFNAINNIASEGVEGLVLNLSYQKITSPSGKVTGTITGTPTTSGKATFKIPGFCSFTVTVDPAVQIFELICNNNTLTVCKPILCGATISEASYIDYTLNYGSKSISRWVSSTISGIYVEVPAQTIKAPSGSIQIYVKGKPTKVGTIRLPITIDGKTCYINVNVAKSGDLTLHCDRAGSTSGYYKKSICNTVYIPYSLSCGKKLICCSTGSKVDGIYAYIPAQYITTPGGNFKVYIKGCPTKTGTIKVPVTIDGKLCYIDVTVK